MSKSFEDAFNLLCGRLIGEGIHRKVFECRLRPDLVVKVESEDSRWRSFANAHEMSIWSNYMHARDISKWLAPCEYLSPDGLILLQKKVDPIGRKRKLPSQLPAFLSDIKRENFGVLDGRLVCVDYAIVIMDPSTKMRKVCWGDQ